MKFEIDKCPYCDGDPTGILETLKGWALLNDREDDTEEFEYAGETSIDWDSQETDEDNDGNVTLWCRPCATTWVTMIDPEEKEDSE